MEASLHDGLDLVVILNNPQLRRIARMAALGKLRCSDERRGKRQDRAVLGIVVDRVPCFEPDFSKLGAVLSLHPLS